MMTILLILDRLNMDMMQEVRKKYGKSTGKVYEKLNANQKKIIEYVENNGMITNKEAQKLLDIRKANQCESAVQC